MPIYEYQCQSCGKRLEKLQKLSDAALSQCPECGKETLTKLISASGFRLKGAGWYETDFKSGNKKNIHGADTGGSATSTASETGSSNATSSNATSSKVSSGSEANSGSKVTSGSKIKSSDA